MFERLGALQARLAGDRLDALLVTQPANVFYLTGFRGTAGVVVLTPDGVCLITDSRYATVARALVDASVGPTLLTFVQVESSYEETIGAVLADSGASRVGIETAHMTVARYDWLERALHGSGVTLCRTTGLVESLRQVKDADELATMRDAGRRISRVMTEMRASLRAGQREREVAADIDWAIRAAGFEGPAFETIVAAGLNTALPHARPGDRRLAAGDLVLLDFGGTLDGYCVDLTRVASLGRPDPAALGWHDAVSEAHGAALAAVGPGVSATEVDTAARAVLERRGLGPAFGHGTGHGLGLEVHEAPRVGKRRRAVASPGIPESNDDLEDVRLEAGMVFTVEPGVYLPGQGGVRLEDDLVVTETGYELLTHVSLDLLVV
jgi:Xaa-Pro aminopeptidase